MKPAPLTVAACYSGPRFWQRLKILWRVFIDIHRVNTREPITFHFMIF